MGGKYRGSDGLLLDRVTTLIGYCIDQSGLVRWSQQESEAQEITERACELGTAVHEVLESFVLGEEIVYSDDFEILMVQQKAVESIEKWQKGTGAQFVHSELMIVDDGNKAGGTTDLVIYIPETRIYEGVVYRKGYHLGDFKTSKDCYTSHYVQIAAYYSMQMNTNNYTKKLAKEIVKANIDKETGVSLYEHNVIPLEMDGFIIRIEKDLEKMHDNPLEIKYINAEQMRISCQLWEEALRVKKLHRAFNKAKKGE